MIIDCISDLHGHYPHLEGGDLLIVAGDLTARDIVDQYLCFYEWLDDQEYSQKIIISGNHDNELAKKEYQGRKDRFYPAIYLEDSGTEFMGFKIWGSPWTKTFKGMNPHCMAFTCNTDEELAEKWALIPEDIDILITHSPPLNIHDRTVWGLQVGSFSLLLKSTGLKNLKLFVWGHIHEAYGHITPQELRELEALKINGDGKCASFPHLINASHVNERYQPVNKPIRVVV